MFIFYGALGVAAYLVWGDRVDSDFIDNLSVGDSNYIWFLEPWLSTVTQFVICISCFFSIPIFAFESRTNLHSILSSAHKTCCAGRNGVHLQAVHDESDHEEDEHLNVSQLFADGMGLRGDHDVDGIESMDNESETRTSRWMEGSVILITAALVALLVSDLSLCLTICGATYGCFISYFLPSGVYIKAMNSWQAQPHSPPLTLCDFILKYIAWFSIMIGLIVCVAGIVTAFL